MPQIDQTLKEKKQQLEALQEARRKANCSTKYSSASDMRRELEIEQLEDEIKALEKQLNE